MIDSFSKGALDKLNSNGYNKYYVYRLIDPRSFQTFYVGKGCDNRVFMHAKAATALISKDEDSIVFERQCVSKRVPVEGTNRTTLVQLDVDNLEEYWEE